MKRTALLRKPPEADRLTVPVLRSRKCRICFTRFTPDRAIVKWCSAECGALVAKEAVEKKAREAEKAVKVADRAKREALKPRSKWLAEAQAAVNALVRYRDRHEGCISCSRPATWDGQWHASHYKSVGAAPALRFDMANIHKACSICNNHLSGNIGAYTPRLLAKVGQLEFDRLNGPQPVVKHTIEEIAAIKKQAMAELKALQQNQRECA